MANDKHKINAAPKSTHPDRGRKRAWGVTKVIFIFILRSISERFCFQFIRLAPRTESAGMHSPNTVCTPLDTDTTIDNDGRRHSRSIYIEDGGADDNNGIICTVFRCFCVFYFENVIIFSALGLLAFVLMRRDAFFFLLHCSQKYTLDNASLCRRRPLLLLSPFQITYLSVRKFISSAFVSLIHR